MNAINRQKLIYLIACASSMGFIALALLTWDAKYSLIAIAFSILTHTEQAELHRRIKEGED